MGTGGGDNGTIGLVSAFRIQDGKRLWDWQTIAGPGQPGHAQQQFPTTDLPALKQVELGGTTCAPK